MDRSLRYKESRKLQRDYLAATCGHSLGIPWGSRLRPLQRPRAATRVAVSCEWLRMAANGCEWLRRVAASG
jgi:hypothetical protein